MFGAVESQGPTTTVNDAEEVLPSESLAEQLTVVVEFGPNVDGEAGEQLTLPLTSPLTRSVAVGE